MHLIIRHGWVGEHHALHWSSLVAAHHALTLRRLLYPHEALEPLLTRQERLVTCEERTPFELVVPRRTMMILYGMRALLHQATCRPFNLCIRSVYFLITRVLLLRADKGMTPKNSLILPSLRVVQSAGCDSGKFFMMQRPEPVLTSVDCCKLNLSDLSFALVSMIFGEVTHYQVFS